MSNSVAYKNVRCIAESSKAVLVKGEDPQLREDTWIPKSVLHDDSEVFGAGHQGRLVIKRWWAEQNGLG